MIRPHTFASAGVLAALVLGAPAAAAQAPSGAAAVAVPAPLSATLGGAAKQAYDSAKLLAMNRDFAGARAEFEHAYALSKDARLLFNMAICDKELHHYARMCVTLERYLREGAEVASPETLSTAREALAAAKPLVAVLKVAVDVAGADVILDGEPLGTTPLAAGVPVDLGKHELVVKKDGFEPFERSIETAGGTEAAISVSLVPERHVAHLAVGAEDDATIVVDGRAVGRGRFDGELSPGTHDLSVSAPDKRAYALSFELGEGETRTLQIALEDAPHGGSAWPWILGGAVVAAGAAAGAYFLLSRDQGAAAPLPQGTFANVRFDAVRLR